ncbi:hypothetical protein BCU44_10655 [Vibrio cyclitrophicus]|nr:hypothetical protein BCU44_10655 [Vibrio cyclitrophicus]
MIMTNRHLTGKFCSFILVFFVIVIAFAFIYSFISDFDGHGIYHNNVAAEGLEFLYFSFVTITTLGYGDFIPKGYNRGVASIESVVGLIYFGVGIANIVSIKQDTLLDYMKKSNDIERFKSCIYDVVNAKEDLADHRRTIENTSDYNELIYRFNKGNPFYDVLTSMQQLQGYVDHLVKTGSVDELTEYIDRACHHVEESIGVIRKTILVLEEKEVNWSQKRTKEILHKVCSLTEDYTNDFLIHSKYNTEPHKGGNFKEVIMNNVKRIRNYI